MRRTMYPVALLICALLASSAAVAQIPRTLSYQGVLGDASGNPLPNPSHSITIRLYEQATGGAALFTESHAVTLDKGIFNIIIGSITPIPPAVSFDREYFLGVAVDGGAELTPRTRLASSPYAIRSGIADALKPGAPGVVTSVNGQTGPVTLVGGGGTSVTQAGGTVTISSTGGGGTGIQGLQNIDGTIGITNPNGPVATIGLADNAVTTLKIADGTVTAADLAAGVIPTGLPPIGNAGGDLIGTYPNPTITVDAVGSAEIADNAIQTGDLANGAVTPAKLGSTGATNGQVLTFNGTGVVYANPATLTLPFSSTVNSASPLFDITNSGSGRAGSFRISSTTSTSNALNVEHNGAGASTITAIYAKHTGNSGIGVLGEATGAAAFGNPPRGVLGMAPNGMGVMGHTTAGHGLYGTSDGAGFALLAANTGTGGAATMSVTSTTNSSAVLSARSSGTGYVGDFRINNTSNTAQAVYASTNGSGEAVFGLRTATTGFTAGVHGESSSSAAGGVVAGPTGVLGQVNATAGGSWSAGVRGLNSSTTAFGVGVIGYQAGNGVGVYAESIAGDGLRANVGPGGNAIVGNLMGAAPSTAFTNNVAIFQVNGLNVARITRTGIGHFNGGAVLGGADVAESFAVEGIRSEYEPGDVLVISTATDRTVERSTEAFSSLVIGVYATKPGVTLTELGVDADHADMVPMGVIGVIPTKVTAENGPIRRGDLLVTSSTRGHAMRVDPAKALPGTIIGKALENFDGEGSGMIRVMVNVK